MLDGRVCQRMFVMNINEPAVISDLHSRGVALLTQRGERWRCPHTFMCPHSKPEGSGPWASSFLSVHV